MSEVSPAHVQTDRTERREGCERDFSRKIVSVNYLQVFGRDRVVMVRNLHLGAVGDALAEDRGMDGCGGRGAVLLGTGLVGLVIAALVIERRDRRH